MSWMTELECEMREHLVFLQEFRDRIAVIRGKNLMAMAVYDHADGMIRYLDREIEKIQIMLGLARRPAEIKKSRCPILDGKHCGVCVEPEDCLSFEERFGSPK